MNIFFFFSIHLNSFEYVIYALKHIQRCLDDARENQIWTRCYLKAEQDGRSIVNFTKKFHFGVFSCTFLGILAFLSRLQSPFPVDFLINPSPHEKVLHPLCACVRARACKPRCASEEQRWQHPIKGLSAKYARRSFYRDGFAFCFCKRSLKFPSLIFNYTPLQSINFLSQHSILFHHNLPQACPCECELGDLGAN